VACFGKYGHHQVLRFGVIGETLLNIASKSTIKAYGWYKSVVLCVKNLT
jgi:hypothetical protein